ncbi:MAG TPA: hypothetical protein PLH15_11385 [Spirochaetota bacterium]|nr:hypothetical protein [Spirochaetota bacterium]HQO21716.1 hypothetical protein [Spirochaetota bacterium]HQQ24429.1 hypothetical protein [Spirochaetota bacterium]
MKYDRYTSKDLQNNSSREEGFNILFKAILYPALLIFFLLTFDYKITENLLAIGLSLIFFPFLMLPREFFSDDKALISLYFDFFDQSLWSFHIFMKIAFFILLVSDISGLLMIGIYFIKYY